MMRFEWNAEKNAWLKRKRQISFEDVVHFILAGNVLDIIEHGNPERYPGQRIFVVEIDGYAYSVPYVESEDLFFLKTVVPSRKLTRRYLKDEKP
jgi:uncharacterized DUF497 family protein